MTTRIYLITLITVLGTFVAKAQEFAGSALYKTDAKLKIMLDSTNQNPGFNEMIQKQLRAAMQKEFKLTFSKTESNWRELPKLGAAPQAADGVDVQIQVIGTGGGNDGLLYKNTQTKKSLEKTDAFGKLFLVDDDLEQMDWEMTSETKQIGKYTCYKAITTREVTQKRRSEVNGETEETEETSQQTITAWYTPEIPVNHGPDRYWGLPGLILEVNDGTRIMICTQVVLNPKEPIEIKIPEKGKKVSGEEYEALVQKHAEKMNKMSGGGKRKGNNSSFEIRIGG